MSTLPTVQRDERTIAVENSSYRWGYLFFSFGLLVLVAYRSFVYHESAWDMMALVVLGGVLSAGYQAFHGVLTRQWAAACLATIVAAAIVAVLVTSLR